MIIYSTSGHECSQRTNCDNLRLKREGKGTAKEQLRSTQIAANHPEFCLLCIFREADSFARTSDEPFPKFFIPWPFKSHQYSHMRVMPGPSWYGRQRTWLRFCFVCPSFWRRSNVCWHPSHLSRQDQTRSCLARPRRSWLT